jgi:transposase
VTGQRKSIKIFGAVDVYRAKFIYKRDTVFNADTYGGFLDDIGKHFRRRGAILVQDNASYHKDKGIWSWFKANRHWLEVYQLPPYSPEFNATERLWHHTRKTGTHNRSFLNEDELFGTLTRVFTDMQNEPNLIRGYLRPFC